MCRQIEIPYLLTVLLSILLINYLATNQECSKCGKPFDDLIVLAGHFNREHDRIDNRLVNIYFSSNKVSGP